MTSKRAEFHEYGTSHCGHGGYRNIEFQSFIDAALRVLVHLEAHRIRFKREQVRGEHGNTRYRAQLGPLVVRCDLETDLQSAGIPGASCEARVQRGCWPDPFFRLRIASTITKGNAIRATLYLYRFM